jgi:hypothetical protein
MGINSPGPKGKQAPVSMGAFPDSGATCRAEKLEASIKLSPKGVQLIDYNGADAFGKKTSTEFGFMGADRLLETAEFHPKTQYLSASAVDGADV